MNPSIQWIFKIDCFDFLAVQGTLKCLLQHHSSKVSLLQHSALFMVQLSYLYVTIGNTIALTRQTFVGKVTSLLFNISSTSLILSSASVILLSVSSRVFLIQLLHYSLLNDFLIYSRSLLNISCIFSNLVSRLFICNSILFSRF